MKEVIGMLVVMIVGFSIAGALVLMTIMKFLYGWFF